jgi:hypothetical protein
MILRIETVLKLCKASRQMMSQRKRIVMRLRF